MDITLTIIEGPQKGKQFSFSQHDTFLVGRSPQAHLQLSDEDTFVSRYHFMIEVNPPLCRLSDLGSHNGTYVNGKRVKTVDLRDGDLIKAGRTNLRVGIPVPEAESSGLPTIVIEVRRQVDRFIDGAAFVADGQATIEGYRLIRELGRGSMGVVYLAECEADRTQVALKTITPAVAGNRIQLERFLREAEILKQLDHPHIVAFRDAGVSGGRIFFAMDYVSGLNAGRLLKQQGPLPVSAAVRLVCQLLKALEYAHDKGIVHRDIKPENILVPRIDGRRCVKLTDFGLARAYRASHLSGLTIHGSVGGTIPFIAPEQILNFRRVQPPSDQYSAAATLYKLLTNKYIHDFPRETVRALSLVIEETPIPIQQRRGDIPDDLADVIHRGLAREPADRFPNARKMRKALLRFVRDDLFS